MTAPKIGRNDPCPCGRGRKYKHCCAGKVAATIKTPTWDDQVAEMGRWALEPNQGKVDTAVHQLAELVKTPGLTQDQKNNGFFAYARALQSYGDHGAALAALLTLTERSDN